MYENYYVLFNLGILAVIILIAGVIRKSYVLSNQMELANRARRRKMKARAANERKNNKKPSFSMTGRKHSPATARQLQNVVTPWGWPQHGHTGKTTSGHPDLAHSLRHIADKLIGSKKTKEDQEYLDKRNASIRALLEDRYGRASRMTEMPYNKVKAPLLRDPGRPYDQLDSMPSSKADAVVSKLSRQKGSAAELKWSARKTVRATETKNIKTPWGW